MHLKYRIFKNKSMKHLVNIMLALHSIFLIVSCDSFHIMEIENNYEKGVYIYFSASCIAPASIDEINDKMHLKYVDAKRNGILVSMLDGVFFKMSTREFVNEVFKKTATDTLIVAIFDAQTLDENWGVGKLSNYIIQQYWLTKEDVLTKNGKSLKKISFPPHEGMKEVKMEPAYGTFTTN